MTEVNDTAPQESKGPAPLPQEAVEAVKQVPTRDVMIKCPADLPDEVVHAAWEIGMQSVQLTLAGLGVLLYPRLEEVEGKKTTAVGMQAVQFLRSEDIQRLLKVVGTLNVINQAILAKSQNAADTLSASVEGSNLKDEAVTRACNEIQGKPTIEIAR